MSDGNSLDKYKSYYIIPDFTINNFINDYNDKNKPISINIIANNKNIQLNNFDNIITQIKSTIKKTDVKNHIGYNFSISKEYDNMITICISYEDKKIWIFEIMILYS